MRMFESCRSVFLLLLAAAIPHASAAERRVIVLTPHVDAIRFEFARGFALWHQQKFGQMAQVEWRYVGGTSDALRFVLSEFSKKPAGIGLDVLFGGGEEPYILLADKKLSVRHQPPPEVLSGLQQGCNGMDVFAPDYSWFGAALSSFGILQNTHVQHQLSLPLARQWSDLADPKVFGWVGAGDPRNSGTMNVMFEAFLQALGWEKAWNVLHQIGGNVRKFDRVSSTTAKDVTLGETAYAFAIDFYGFSQIAVAGRSNMSFVLPQDFTAINADGIAILKGAPNLATAGRFIDFVLSEEGQKLWFFRRGERGGPQQFSIERMPIRPDFYRRFRAASNIEFSPFDLKNSFSYNANRARERREVLAALVGALLVDTHPELQKAWRRVVARNLPAEDLAQLGRMPLSEADAFKLAAAWKDPAVRNLKKIEWQSWAQEKYRKLASRK